MNKWFKEKILSSNKNTILFIGFFCFMLFFFYQIALLFKGTYYNSNSDDVYQYSSILGQYIGFFKDGNIGWFNFTNNTGASVFADVYYVPIDIFTLITFLLSFIMNYRVAFSCVELLKILSGVVAFAIFAQKKNFKNGIVLLMAFIYFAVGGSLVYSTFPTYLSMFFCLPISLLVVESYKDGNRWFLPLYCLVLILYNFYNAYTLFVFMIIVYGVIVIRDNYKGIKNFLLNIFGFGLRIILGVMMGLFILLPSVLYILNYTSRLGANFEFLFDYSVYLRMICKLFVYESSIECLVTSKQLVGGYAQNQFSIYIGVYGLYLLILLFFFKDKESKIYKWTIVAILLMMIFPIFSMLFSGVMQAYTRWFSFINIIFIYYIGYIYNSGYLQNIKPKENLIAFGIIFALFTFVYIFNIIELSNNDNINDSVHNLYYIFMLSISFIFIILYACFSFANQKKMMHDVFCLELIVAIVIGFSVPFRKSELLKVYNEYDELKMIVDNLDVNSDGLERIYISDSQINDSRLFSNLTSEKSFHSFFNKNIYSYLELTDGEDHSDELVLKNVGRYSPNYSRIVDYKFLVLKKDRISNYNLDYLSKFYETENYIVYINNNYEPFYVYEDYFVEDEIRNKNIFDFEKNLFNGVILEEDNYNLNKVDYQFNNIIYSSSVENEFILNKIEEGKYESDFSNYSTDVVLKVYIRSLNNYDNIKSVKYVKDENEEVCKFVGYAYVCEENEGFDKIIVETNSPINSLYYSIFLEEDENEYAVVSIDKEFEKDYLEYDLDGSNIWIRYSSGLKKECLDDFCVLDEKSVDYIYFEYGYNSVLKNNVNLYYINDDMGYYNSNNVDLFASEKSLSYNKSKINIKYKRLSNSSKDQIIALPITYSEEWKLSDSTNYEIVRVNGGYLGILVKENVENINISLEFEPSGLKSGVLGSFIGVLIYVVYVILENYKKRRFKR